MRPVEKNNPYLWLSDYFDAKNSREILYKRLQEYHASVLHSFRLIGFEYIEMSRENLTFSFKTKNAPYESFVPTSQINSYPKNVPSRLGSEASPLVKQMTVSSQFNRQTLETIKESLPIEIQKLSEYTPSLRKRVLCYQDGNFDYILIFKKEIENRIQDANKSFDTIILRCSDKKEYINSIVDFLMKGCKSVRGSAAGNHDTHRIINEIVSKQLSVVLKHIYDNYSDDLNKVKLNQLNKFFSPVAKSSIKSFKIKSKTKLSSNYSFDKAVDVLRRATLIAKDADSRHFANIFEGIIMTTPINWIDDITSLYTFIRRLYESELIEDTKLKHWKITTACFTLNGANIDPKSFPNLKITEDSKKLRAISTFISMLRRL